MNIYQKLAAITADLQAVAKNLTVSTGKNSYKAVSERDIIDAVKPLEAKHGVYSYPVSRETLESERLESESYDGKTKTTFFTRIKTVYRFVNTEDPQDFIETVVFSVGLDSGDKGDGKAMTYGDKYALMKAYKISTGDDPDQSASVDTEYSSVSRQTILDQIYALDVTRKELDAFIQSKKPDKDADTVSLADLRSIKTAILQKRRNA